MRHRDDLRHFKVGHAHGFTSDVISLLLSRIGRLAHITS